MPAPRGILIHRMWECACTQENRGRLVPAAVLQRYHTARDGESFDVATWTRALLPLPLATVHAPIAEETFALIWAPPDGCLSGRVYTDGSLIAGPPRLSGTCRRLGWAFVALNDSAEVCASASGVPSSWVTTIYGAELWALHMATLHALPGSALRTNCQSPVRVSQNGRKGRQAAAAALPGYGLAFLQPWAMSKRAA